MCWRLIELNKAAGEQCQGRTKPLTRLCSFLWEFKDFCKKRKLFCQDDFNAALFLGQPNNLFKKLY